MGRIAENKSSRRAGIDIALPHAVYTGVQIYLNDHLAGSVTALELLEHLEKTHAGTTMERFAAELRRATLQTARSGRVRSET
jgi:hypothetical protein